MKTHINKLLVTLPVLALFIACQTTTVELYDRETDGMYFKKSVANNLSQEDTIRLAFGSLPDPYVESAVFAIPVSLMGSIADTDREFGVEVLKDKTNPDTRYEILRPLILEAGADNATINIRVWRTENLSVRDTITLQLVPTSDLAVKTLWACSGETTTSCSSANSSSMRPIRKATPGRDINIRRNRFPSSPRQNSMASVLPAQCVIMRQTRLFINMHCPAGTGLASAANYCWERKVRANFRSPGRSR